MTANNIPGQTVTNPPDFRDVLQQAAEFASKGDIEAAEAKYAVAIQLADANPQPLMMRAQFYMECERYEQAIADYTTAIQIVPMAMFYVGRCMAYEAAGQIEQAIADCTTALTLRGVRKADMHHRRGALYMKKADFSAAIADFSAAIADFSAAIEHNSRSFRHYYERAIAYEQINDPQQAAADWRQVIALCNPNDPEAQEAQSRLDAL